MSPEVPARRPAIFEAVRAARLLLENLCIFRLAAPQQRVFCDAASAPICRLCSSIRPCSLRSNCERPITVLLSILHLIRAWQRRNAGWREMSQLGDRELSDIGISR